MGQVPFDLQNHGAARSRRYAIVGDGRMARHFAHYLRLLGVPHVQWSRKLEAHAGASLAAALDGSDVVLLLISDSAIEPFIESRPELVGRTPVHFSGSLATPLARGFHPLMTFGEELYSLAEYREIPFIGETGGPELREIFPDLPNPSFSLAPELKPLYHSLCVLSGNFTVLLWQKLFRDLEDRLGIPHEAALPYLRRVAANLASRPENALTGPLQRKDLATVRRNIESLEGDSFQPIYRSFVDLLVPEAGPRSAYEHR